MKYLILGGAGFIGINLTKRLIANGHTVTIVDSLATSREPEPVQNMKFIKGDVRTEPLDDLINDHDIVYHFASSVGVSYIDNNPQEALFNNVEMMNKLIPLFEKYQKKVIFASTSEVYGEGPFAELDNASIGPSTKLRWGYATSKLLTEFMMFACTFPFVIVRFFNVTGKGQLADYGMVLPNFVQRAINDQPLIVHGDGTQIRSFCHVEDSINALLLVENKDREIYNIGSDNQISIYDLALRVTSLVDSKSDIILTPYEEIFSNHHGEIYNRTPDLTKIRNIGFQPKHQLDDIIRSML